MNKFFYPPLSCQQLKRIKWNKHERWSLKHQGNSFLRFPAHGWTLNNAQKLQHSYTKRNSLITAIDHRSTFREILLPSSGLSKRSPLKHTCSWRDKLIALQILNRQATIFLRRYIGRFPRIFRILNNTVVGGGIEGTLAFLDNNMLIEIVKTEKFRD